MLKHELALMVTRGKSLWMATKITFILKQWLSIKDVDSHFCNGMSNLIGVAAPFDPNQNFCRTNTAIPVQISSMAVVVLLLLLLHTVKMREMRKRRISQFVLIKIDTTEIVMVINGGIYWLETFRIDSVNEFNASSPLNKVR